MASLDALAHAGINDRLTGVDLSPFDGGFNEGSSSTWSTTFWGASLNFSGVVMGNDREPDPAQDVRSGTLISPRHILGVGHQAVPEVGDKVFFAKPSGSLYTAEITGRVIISTTPPNDFSIGYLDADVPTGADGIPFYKILPSDWLDFLDPENQLPICFQSGHTDGVIEPNIVLNDFQIGETFEDPGAALKYVAPTTFSRDGYWHGPDTNDSGYPGFLVLGDDLVLVGIHSGAVTHMRFEDVVVLGQATAINAAMLTAETAGGGGVGYQLTAIDLSTLSIPTATRWSGLSVVGVPGRQLSAVAKEALTVFKVYNLTEAQARLDGLVKGQSRIDGVAEMQSEIDGMLAGQAEPA